MRLFPATNAAIRNLQWVRHVKNWRNRILDTAFRKSGHEARDAFLADFSPNHDIVVFAIAFNAPWVIELLTAAWQLSVRDADLVVIDNSSSAAARERHRKICRSRGVAYLALPKNREWSANRSHGIAMNWVFYNLVEKLKPKHFGFIDHDCFPTVPVSFAELIAGKAVYGRKDLSAKSDKLWSLWAGFCFFRYGMVAGKPLDFKHRPEYGMDTGAGNWWPLYVSLTDDQIGVADSVMIESEAEGFVFKEQSIAHKFCHIGGVSYRAEFLKDGARSAYQTYLWRKYLSESPTVRCMNPTA